ncbi:MAG: excisionase family DNA-binding protein [Cetobacterium sp.]|uniref:excisionase family DNA-binding protein n=1 Tax=Cetobacterium sp. TaxID=2071632 RepID=UPI003F33D341
MEKLYYTVEEVSKRTGIPLMRLYYLLRNDEICGIRIYGRKRGIRIHHSFLEEYEGGK